MRSKIIQEAETGLKWSLIIYEQKVSCSLIARLREDPYVFVGIIVRKLTIPKIRLNWLKIIHDASIGQ